MNEREIYIREFGEPVAEHIFRLCEAARGATPAVAGAPVAAVAGARAGKHKHSGAQGHNAAISDGAGKVLP